MQSMRSWLLALLLPTACSSRAAPPAREFLDDPGLRQSQQTMLVWQRCGEDGEAYVSAVVSREGRIDAVVPVLVTDAAALLSLSRRPPRHESRSTTLSAEELSRLRGLMQAASGAARVEARPARAAVQGGGFGPESSPWPYAEIDLLIGDGPKAVIYERIRNTDEPGPAEKSPRAEILAVDAFLREILRSRFRP